MNLVKWFWVERRTRGGVGASGEVEASLETSLLPALNPRTGLWPTSSFCSPVRSAGELMQGLHQARDSGVIAMEI